LSETYLILRRIQRDISINVHRSPCKLPVILFIFWRNMIFPDRFSKHNKISKFHPPRGSRLVPSGRTDGQTDWQTNRQNERKTDMTKLLADFRSFPKAPKQGFYVGRHQVAVLLLTLPMPGCFVASWTNFMCLETFFNYIASTVDSVGFSWQENGNNFAATYSKC
jgi:hypothetical protein